MIHGDEIVVVPSGPRIRPKSLEPIGVSHRSRCWGIWVGDSGEGTRNKENVRHLLISPHRPESWPFIFRLTVRIRDLRGALHEVARILREQQVDILFAECASSGHNHATWNLIGESHRVRNSIRRGYAEKSENKRSSAIAEKRLDPEGRVSLAADIRQQMLLHFLQIQDELEKKDHEHHKLGDAEQPPFLHERFLNLATLKERGSNEELIKMLEGGVYGVIDNLREDPDAQERLFGKRKGNDEWIGRLKTLNEEQCARAIQFRILPSLTHLWLHANDLESPLKFRYNVDCWQLQPDSIEEFEDAMHRVGARMPTKAAASFDTTEHFVRLNPLAERRRRRLALLDVGYHATYKSLRNRTPHEDPSTDNAASDPRESTLRCSMGLLESLTGKIAEHHVNLTRVSNMITQLRRDDEEGRIALAAEMEHADDPESIQKLVADLEAMTLRGPGARTVSVTEVNVGPDRINTVFLSMHMATSDDHGRTQRLRDAIDEAATHVGLDVVLSETRSANVTEEVIENFHGCDCLLQVVTRRLREDAESIDVAWLVGEYLVAAALELPRVRVVDTHGSGMTRGDWWRHLKVQRDQDFVEFDAAGDDEHLQMKLRLALTELGNELEKRRSRFGGIRGFSTPRARTTFTKARQWFTSKTAWLRRRER